MNSALLPPLLLGIARLGYHGPIPARALSSLVAHADEHGLEAVIAWIEADPGYLFVPSWQFFYLPGPHPSPDLAPQPRS